MAYFLAKTDPEHYSIADLERDGTTVWDGVRNAAALQAIRAMRPGDEGVDSRRSQGEAAIVGLARVVSRAASRPQQPEKLGGGPGFCTPHFAAGHLARDQG